MTDVPTPEEVDLMTTSEIAAWFIENGLVARGADGHLDLTPFGRRELGVVDDKSLIQIALEQLCEEVITEEFEKQAGRSTAKGRQ